MEQRQYPRFPVHIEVRYTVLGPEPKQLNGYACDVSERGLRLVSESELLPGTFVRIDIDDTVMFAEVKYSVPWMDMHVAGVYVEEVLLGTSLLSELIFSTMSQVPKVTRQPVALSGCEPIALGPLLTPSPT